ncbi:hypothetical protein [Lysobacter sp. Root604]|uniref:hypothetical protein n=1 Tax=Lysobacter sp. Root604 TaxID=1736568 RepID=UPI000B1772EC|nr:hypothetical protein [Lysobacter sp. Root604]
MPKLQGIAAVAALVVGFSGVAGAIDSRGAVRAANISAEAQSGDDIQFDYAARHVQIADFDRNGVDEVVYLQTATCLGANFDCENDIIVMTPMRKDDSFWRPSSLDNDYIADLKRRGRQSGYAWNASLHVPGEVRALAIVGDRIQVTFDVLRDSPICKRSIEREASNPCPEPGRYRWSLSWRPGEVSKTHEVALGGGGKTATRGTR